MSFKTFLPFVEDAVAFAFRRAWHLLAGRPTPMVVVVDVDYTLVDGFVSWELLSDKIGREKATELKNQKVRKLESGQSTIDEVGREIDGLLQEHGAKKSDWDKTMERLEREGKIRQSIIEGLKELRSEGKKIIIITMGVCHSAKWIAGRYGFDAGYGRVEHEGVFTELIGAESGTFDGIPVKTKWDKVREFCEEFGVPFRKRNIAMISDSIFDSRDMRRTGLAVLIANHQMAEHQRLAVRLKTYDALLPLGENVKSRMKKLFGRPVAKRPANQSPSKSVL